MRRSEISADVFLASGLRCKTTDMQGESADMHRLAPESSDHQFDVSQSIFKTKSRNPYRLLYEIRGSDVFILTIRGLGQDYYGAK